MLTEELAFGDVCYDRKTLEKTIPRAYAEKQKSEHIDNYGLIVEHHDGKNAERFIEMNPFPEIKMMLHCDSGMMELS